MRHATGNGIVAAFALLGAAPVVSAHVVTWTGPVPGTACGGIATLTVETGDLIRILASGTIDPGGPYGTVGPNGALCGPHPSSLPFPGRAPGSLVGWIGSPANPLDDGLPCRWDGACLPFPAGQGPNCPPGQAPTAEHYGAGFVGEGIWAVAPADGTLYLGVNASNCSGNAGAFQATVARFAGCAPAIAPAGAGTPGYGGAVPGITTMHCPGVSWHPGYIEFGFVVYNAAPIRPAFLFFDVAPLSPPLVLGGLSIGVLPGIQAGPYTTEGTGGLPFSGFVVTQFPIEFCPPCAGMTIAAQWFVMDPNGVGPPGWNVTASPPIVVTML